jgi:hypothetical protein
MKSYLISLSAVFLFAGPCLYAGSARVEVGDASVTGSHLRPYTNLWNLTQQKPGGTVEEVGTWSDSLESTVYKGQPAMKRTQIANYEKKGIQLTFVSVFDPKSCRRLWLGTRRTFLRSRTRFAQPSLRPCQS